LVTFPTASLLVVAFFLVLVLVVVDLNVPVQPNHCRRMMFDAMSLALTCETAGVPFWDDLPSS